MGRALGLATLAAVVVACGVAAHANAVNRPVSRLIGSTGQTLCRVTRDTDGSLLLPDDSSEELYVEYDDRRKMRAWAGLTHWLVGSSVPTGRGSWKVWSGRTLVGVIEGNGPRLKVTRVARRFVSPGDGFGLDHLKPGYVGYAVGADRLAAATAYLLLGTCG